MNQSNLQMYKCRIQGKDGKFYDNLYFRLNDGGYFQFRMVFFNSNVWRAYMANAIEVTPDVINGGKSND